MEDYLDVISFQNDLHTQWHVAYAISAQPRPIRIRKLGHNDRQNRTKKKAIGFIVDENRHGNVSVGV